MIPANDRSTFYRQPQRMNSVQLGPNTLLSLAREKQTLENVITTLKLLEPDDFIDFMLDYYTTGLARFGDEWGYADQLTVLNAVASLVTVENYLEIGVFRGRSLAVVAGLASDANLFGFDLWVENYSGLENPGPEFVHGQLARVGYQGEALFISGHSQETLPSFLESHPDLYFDIITVDGDHSYVGAYNDLQNVLPRVKLGGVLVFDDIRHPKHLILEHVWDEVVSSDQNFITAKYTDIGHGVAVAVRTGIKNGWETSSIADQEHSQASSKEGYPTNSTPARENTQLLHEPSEKLQKSASQQIIRHIKGELREQAMVIHDLNTSLQECEQDRSARLKAINTLENQLQECEADRSARLEAIHTLENQLQKCEVDRSARLEAIHTLENQLQECEVDRSARLEIIRKLEKLKQEHEDALNWSPIRALVSMRNKLK